VCGDTRRSLQTGKLTVLLPRQDKRAMKSSQYDCKSDLYELNIIIFLCLTSIRVWYYFQKTKFVFFLYKLIFYFFELF